MSSPSAVIVVISHKARLADSEKASLRQCYRVLAAYPIRLVCPAGLDVSDYLSVNPSCTVDFINPKWQRNYEMFNRLKVSTLLYRKYKAFDYILFYELDAWVFRDELEYWCNKGYDYIGAPWYEGWQLAAPGAPCLGVGNGGFSLRNVRAHLRVLSTLSYIVKPKVLFDRYQSGSVKLWHVIARLTVTNNTFFLLNHYGGNEDIFWGRVAPGNCKWFKVAPEAEALRFAVETNPSQHVTDERMLPFGCHGWTRYEPDFWKKHIDAEFGETSGQPRSQGA